MAAGRKTLWKPEYAEQARKLCLLGATDIELADFFGIANSTFSKWKKAQPDLQEALKLGKQMANAEVAGKLYHRAIGYSHPETVVKILGGKIELVEVQKHYAPDTTAAIFFLKNRDRERWRDRQEVDHSGSINYSNLTEDELERKIAELSKD